MRRLGMFALAICFAAAGDMSGGGAPPSGGTPPAGAEPPAGGTPPAPGATPPDPGGTPPAPGGTPPASDILNPPAPTPAAFPLTNIADPLQAQLIRDKGWVNADGHVDVSQLTNGYFHANRLISGDAPSILRVPDAQTATADDWNSVYKALGRPDTPDQYQVNWGENANDKMVEFGKGFLHELGVPQNKMQGAVDKWNTFQATMSQEMAAASEAENQQAVETLQTQMGNEWNDFLASGQRAVKALGIADDVLDKAAGAIGLAPVLEIFAKIGKAMPSEAGMPAGQGGGTNDPSGMTPQMAQQEIDRLNADADFQKAYLGANEPGHRDAVQRMNALFARVSAGRQT